MGTITKETTAITNKLEYLHFPTASSLTFLDSLATSVCSVKFTVLAIETFSMDISEVIFSLTEIEKYEKDGVNAL